MYKNEQGRLTAEEITGALGFNLCAYLVALEGWRRGLTLRWHYDTSAVTHLKVIDVHRLAKTFSLTSEQNSYVFYRSRGELVSNEAMDICQDKDKTKVVLDNAGVPVPKGKVFSQSATDEELVQFVEEIGYPVVLKPTRGSQGRGVYTNVINREGFLAALDNLRSEFKYSKYVIESYVEGNEYRLYVVDDQVIGAINRVPANVIGDGKSTIKKLIQKKNNEKKKNPYLSVKLIKIDFEVLYSIKSLGYSLESIPPKGETIFLRQKSNVSAGGDPLDATHLLSPEVKEIAVNAVKSIPGLPHAGVDVIVDSRDEKKCTIIEVNASAALGLHLFPMIGEVRNVPAAIIDLYFPETIGIEQKSKFYFDYKLVKEALNNHSFDEIKIPDAPLGEVNTKRLMLKGKNISKSQLNDVRRKALAKNIHGYIEFLEKDKITCLFSSSVKDDISGLKKYILATIENSKEIHEEDWDSPLKVGFEIKTISEGLEVEALTADLKEKNKKIKELEKKISALEEEKKRLINKNKAIQSSKSWRYTEFFRKIVSSRKKP